MSFDNSPRTVPEEGESRSNAKVDGQITSSLILPEDTIHGLVKSFLEIASTHIDSKRELYCRLSEFSKHDLVEYIIDWAEELK